jgi:hypothetical protein
LMLSFCFMFIDITSYFSMCGLCSSGGKVSVG